LSPLPLRRPPTPTLFPYPTLFRSRRVGTASVEAAEQRRRLEQRQPPGEQLIGHASLRLLTPLKSLRCLRRRQTILWDKGAGPRRSEEHTSELQSLTNLVCRLLLEK